MIVQVSLKDRDITKINVNTFILKNCGDKFEAIFMRHNDRTVESFTEDEVKRIYYSVNGEKELMIDMVGEEHVYKQGPSPCGSLSFNRHHGPSTLTAVHTSFTTGDWQISPMKFISIGL